PDEVVPCICHCTINSRIGGVEQRAARHLTALHHFEFHGIPDLRAGGSIERGSIFPLGWIERPLIYRTRRRHIEGVAVLSGRRGKRELGGPRSRIVGVRIGVRCWLLAAASLLPSILKAKRSQGENSPCNCQEKQSSHIPLLCDAFVERRIYY